MNSTTSEKNEIQQMINLEGKLICFSEDSISEILTAQTIDPQNEHPETRHSYQVIYQIGTKNSIVSRTIVQADDILSSVVLREGVNKKEVLDLVWSCSKYLLNCESSFHSIFSQVEDLVPKCDAIVTANINSNCIPSLPQVEHLEQHVVAFYGNAKRFLESAHLLLCLFYGSPDSSSNFEAYRAWMAKHKPDCENVINLVDGDKKWIQFISWSRNALDVNHSRPRFKVEINNFKLYQGNKIGTPGWRYDFRDKNGGVQSDASDIIFDMDVHVSNMLTFLEELFLVCIQDNWKCNCSFHIYKRKDEDVNISKPSIYYISLK